MTMPMYLGATRPESDNLVVEVDPGIVDLDRRELGFRESEGVRVAVADARTALASQPTDDRDFIIGDAFGYFAVPWHLTTREFIADIRRVLRPDGIYVLNLIDFAPADLARAELATLRAVFPHVAVISSDDALGLRGGGNFVMVASERELPLAAINERLQETKMAGYLRVAGEAETARLVGDARVLTDDYAPVDQLITVPFEYW
jgi:spermidine synthase